MCTYSVHVHVCTMNIAADPLPSYGEISSFEMQQDFEEIQH